MLRRPKRRPVDKKCRVEFGEDYDDNLEEVRPTIRVYTKGYDKLLVEGYKRLNHSETRYRPVWQDNRVLYWAFERGALNDVLDILNRHGYTVTNDINIADQQKVVAASKKYADYPTSDDGLTLILEKSSPGDPRWAERVLREQKNFRKLMYQNDRIKIAFNIDNAREVFVKMQLEKEELTFLVAIPIDYPTRVPLTKLEGNFLRTNFRTRERINYYKEVTGACLGILKKQWKPEMTIAHFVKLFASYLSASQYAEPLPKGLDRFKITKEGAKS
jgi:ubiquitin-protein ligase